VYFKNFTAFCDRLIVVKRKLNEVSKLPDSRSARGLYYSIEARVSSRTVAVMKETDVMQAVSMRLF
jgi:CRISPR/Cas system endoribonuclease Cas6 (RAMP superfamily)